MPENNSDILLYMFIGTFAVIIFIGLLISLAQFINDFSRELRYLNNEIGRTNGEERKYWIKQKKRLWLSLIPFFKY